MKYANMNQEQTMYTVHRMPVLPLVPEIPDIPVVAAVDVETSGIGDGAKLVELGITCFQYQGGLRIVGRYSGFQDPGHPMDPHVIKIHGITDDQVRGQALDTQEIERLIHGSKYVVAHNAQFDRLFVDLVSKASRVATWLCSFEMLDWQALGQDVRKLPVLCERNGFFYDAHRAVVDTDALAHLLCCEIPDGGATYLQKLLEHKDDRQFQVLAIGSPFSSKDQLKSQFFKWDGISRVWGKSVWEYQLPELLSWMDEKVYNGRGKPKVEEIPVEHRFL